MHVPRLLLSPKAGQSTGLPVMLEDVCKDGAGPAQGKAFGHRGAPASLLGKGRAGEGGQCQR